MDQTKEILLKHTSGLLSLTCSITKEEAWGYPIKVRPDDTMD